MERLYEPYSPGAEAQAVIAQAIRICRTYRAQGYDLTLRQIYYQFVSRGLIENTMRSYKRLGDILNKARLGGLLDWSYLVDRTRNLRSVGHWSDPADIIRACGEQFAIDKWAGQKRRVEVWVEKDALAGIVGQVATRHDVAYFACRGYVSQSELWSAARRHLRYIEGGQGVVVLHLGDHDPSGIDMTRDIRDRLEQFIDVDWLHDHGDEFMSAEEIATGQVKMHRIKDALRSHLDGVQPIEVNRIALNMHQVEEYNPPPNPAKLTDSRIAGYIAAHGHESWELDALDPATLDELIESHILDLRDDTLYSAHEATEQRHRDLISAVAGSWSSVVDMIDGQ